MTNTHQPLSRMELTQPAHADETARGINTATLPSDNVVDAWFDGGKALRLLAVLVTFTATSMTAVAASDRGGTLVDKALLVTLSVVIVLAVHLLLALSRRPVAWLVWTGCLLCAIYGHLTFLTYASQRASENRAHESALVVGTERQIIAARDALAEIKARPVSMVAAELATSSDRRQRAALREEIAGGKRAQALQDELIRLSGIATTAQVTGETDPVTATLAAVTGMTESGVKVVIGMTFSILLELIGALLWFEALRHNGRKLPGTPEHTTEAAEPVTEAVTSPVTALQQAIESGACRGTVASIRAHLNCSQARAMELRRELLAAAVTAHAEC